MLQHRGAVLTGLGVGAGFMYLLDPGRGRRRRARVRDRMAHAATIARDAAGATGRDLAHRASGAVARVRGRLARRTVDDVVLAERVRARLGRLVSHPHSVEIEAAGGVVTLRGPILRAEVRHLLDGVGRVPGVREVVNGLDEHKQAGSVPGLQGGGRPPAAGPNIRRRDWSPATRFFAGTAGLALAGYGAARRTARDAALAAAGVGLIARAATNLDARRLTGIGARRRAVDVQKTITVGAPPERVFGFWAAYENFPRFMSHVLEVRPGAQGRQSHWSVVGPGGLPVEFDAEVSAFVPNEVLGWRTVEGASVAHAGIVRFEPAGGGKTRIHIRMSYNPPGGWFGHGVAAVFGVDPKRSLDADLVRMKTLLETGRPPHDAAQRNGGS